MNEIVKSVSLAIRDARPARAETEALKHKELQRRSAIYASILQSGEGSKAFEKAKSALKGELPQADFTLDLEKYGITDADIQSMFNKIRVSELKPFQKLNTSEALTKLLNGQIPTEGEINTLEKMFGKEFVEAIISKYTMGKKVGRFLQEFLNIPRTLQTIADISATLRQGIVLAAGQPIQFTKAFISELKAVFSEKNYTNLNFILDNMQYSDKALEHKLYQAHNAGVASLTSYEEGFQGRILEKVPLLKNIIRGSERAYTMFLDTLRMETFAYYCRKWEGTGKSWKDYDNLASFVNHATGRGDLGRLSNAGVWLNAAFFSPRFVVSRIQVPLDLITSTPAVRKIVARNLVAFVSTGLVALMLAKLAGADVEDEPLSSDFGKIKIGNTRIDFWGSYLPYVRMVSQIVMGQRKSTATGDVYDVNRIDIASNFLRSKLAPVPGMVWDLAAGETFLGEELKAENAQQLVYERLTPIFIQDINDAVRDSGEAGLLYGALAMLGVGVQTYENNWNSTENQLGIPKQEDILPYTITNIMYGTKDYYSEVGQMIGNANADMLKAKKMIPAKVISVAEARDLKKILSIIPNERLKNINADAQQGDTFEQYFIQWQQREKITDTEELKKFDTQYPNAHLGNFSQSEYVLLQQYHALPLDEQAQFLKDHPEININPRTEWLKSHPKENALLAVWGQSKILTKPAYDEFKKLVTELDIPNSALPESTLPPEDTVDDYFAYLEVQDKRSSNAWEAQIILANNDKLREFLGRDPIETPVASLELKVKYRDLYDQIDSYSDKDSPAYIDSDASREEAIAKLKADNPGWVDDMRRIDAIEHGGENYQEQWAERGHIIDGDKIGSSDKAGTSEAKAWLLDNPDVFKWALDNELLTDDGADWNVPSIRIDVKWRAQDNEYDALPVDGTAREEYLADNPEYRQDRRRRDAYQLKDKDGNAYPETQVENYVSYYELPERGKRRDRYLIENPDFADSMHKIAGIDLPEKVPSVQYDDLYDQYQADFSRMEGMGDNKSKYYIENVKDREKARESLRIKNGKLTDFGKAEIRRNAYGMYVPDEYVDRYVDYYSLLSEGIPKDWPRDRTNNRLSWYGDEWYLKEHPAFYENVYLDLLENEPIDFTKTPSREVFDKYTQYVNLIEGQPRDEFRAKEYAAHGKDFEDWLLLTKKITTPIWEKKRRSKLSPSERRREEMEERIKKIKV